MDRYRYFVTPPVFREFVHFLGVLRRHESVGPESTRRRRLIREGHPPKTFETGTATSDSVRSNKGSLEITQNIGSRQWKGYSITNVSVPEVFGMWIDNTENTITRYAGPGGSSQSARSTDQSRCALDQSGAGKGDLLKNAINTVTGEIRIHTNNKRLVTREQHAHANGQGAKVRRRPELFND
jgi:hypothetical protein